MWTGEKEPCSPATDGFQAGSTCRPEGAVAEFQTFRAESSEKGHADPVTAERNDKRRVEAPEEWACGQNTSGSQESGE